MKKNIISLSVSTKQRDVVDKRTGTWKGNARARSKAVFWDLALFSGMLEIAGKNVSSKFSATEARIIFRNIIGRDFYAGDPDSLKNMLDNFDLLMDLRAKIYRKGCEDGQEIEALVTKIKNLELAEKIALVDMSRQYSDCPEPEYRGRKIIDQFKEE